MQNFVPRKGIRKLFGFICLVLVLTMLLNLMACNKTRVGLDSSAFTEVISDAANENETVSEDEAVSEDETASEDDVETETQSDYTVSNVTVSKTETSDTQKTDTEKQENVSSSSKAEEEEVKTPWVSRAPAKNRTPITVSQVVEKNGRYYVEHNSKPYIQYGVQISPNRISSFTEAQKEEFFAKAAEIGFKTVIVAVEWGQIEPQEGKYNLYWPSKCIEYADKYDLNLEILWFGCNVCGSITSAPKYVQQDEKRFPKKSRDLDYSNTLLIKKESEALSVLMDYFYDNDTQRRVSAVQILNEPNFLVAYNVQKDAFLNYLDKLGMVVKNSPYRVVTRVNLVINEGFLNRDYKMPEEILELEGIDMVGPDLYVSDLEMISSYVKRFTTGTMSKNVSHLAEAPGQMQNVIKQILHSFSLNSGYKVYELKAYGNVDCDFGVYRNDALKWTKRDGTLKAQFQWDTSVKIAENVTDDIAMLNGMINSVSEKIANCPLDNFEMIFRQMNGKIGSQKIYFATKEQRTANRIGAIFLADDGYYYFFTPAESGSFSFEEKTVTGKASIGKFVNGQWQESGSVNVVDGNKINVSKGNVYRISASQIQ